MSRTAHNIDGPQGKQAVTYIECKAVGAQEAYWGVGIDDDSNEASQWALLSAACSMISASRCTSISDDSCAVPVMPEEVERNPPDEGHCHSVANGQGMSDSVCLCKANAGTSNQEEGPETK